MSTKESAILLAQLLALVVLPIELTPQRVAELKAADRRRFGSRRHVDAKVTHACRKAA